MRLYLTALLLALIGVADTACAAGKKRVQLDSNTASSIVDGDATVVIVGCDRKPNVGFAFCRVGEGDNSGHFIAFVAPAVKCDREECAFFKVWNSQGSLVWGGSIPKGGTSIRVDWKTLLGRDKFEAFDRGFWTVNETLYWIDPDGRERQSTAQGDILLRVHKKSYLPLNNVAEDANYVWEGVEGNYLFKFTSSLRSYVEEVKPK
jgi:hypothetical protein